MGYNDYNFREIPLGASKHFPLAGKKQIQRAQIAASVYGKRNGVKLRTWYDVEKRLLTVMRVL